MKKLKFKNNPYFLQQKHKYQKSHQIIPRRTNSVHDKRKKQEESEGTNRCKVFRRVEEAMENYVSWIMVKGEWLDGFNSLFVNI